MNIKAIISKDPLVKMLTGKGGTTKKRRKAKKGGLTTSEKRIVNAVSRRVKTKRVTKRRKRY